MLWDIFCKVIDNHGDIGVCWRLSSDLATRGEQVRLWVDDASPLAWMAPGGQDGVEVRAWDADTVFAAPGAVVIEAFGCDLPASFVERMAAAQLPPRWINLEYLTAESFAERAHRLPSPVLSGAGAGMTKHFFYPGFTVGTGGLLREPELVRNRSQFERDPWLRTVGVVDPQALAVSLFCYEPPALASLLRQLGQLQRPVHLLVTSGRAAAAVRALVASGEVPAMTAGRASSLSVTHLALLPQSEYDRLLWACDINFVRGEDSLVRALWAGRPFVWQAYPQQDGAHQAKLGAFLDWMQAPLSLRQFHAAWNGSDTALGPLDLPAWQLCVNAARRRALLHDDLASQLLRFAQPSQ